MLKFVFFGGLTWQVLNKGSLVNYSSIEIIWLFPNFFSSSVICSNVLFRRLALFSSFRPNYHHFIAEISLRSCLVISKVGTADGSKRRSGRFWSFNGRFVCRFKDIYIYICIYIYWNHETLFEDIFSQSIFVIFEEDVIFEGFSIFS